MALITTAASVIGIGAGINSLTGGGITNLLGGGGSSASGAAGQASNLADPFQGSRGTYGTMLNQLMSGGQQQQQTLQNQPGYQFSMQQGLNAISGQSAATGMMGSGNELGATEKFASGLASQNYNTYFNQLAELSGASWNNGAAAGSAIQTGQNIGNSQTMGGLSTLTSGLGALSNSSLFGNSGGGNNANNPANAGYALGGQTFGSIFGNGN